MAELNYEDFKRRVNIQDLLVDAGYRLNRRDGLRYPSYVRTGNDGRRVRGDKFIVTNNGLCCFQPPQRKNYNVISFIKEHPHFFSEYIPGMNTDRLVNLVCNRLLNHPVEGRFTTATKRERLKKVFDLKEYERLDFRKDDWDSQKAFYPYFKSRGITLDTQRAFSNHFLIAMKEAFNGKTYTNLSFPLRKPDDPATIVGLEERGRINSEGKAYKGMAAGSNASEGMWIACPAGEALDKVKDVYWFESAYDAMAFYQIHKNELQRDNNRDSEKELSRLDKSVFVSTGGNPSIHQFKAMIIETPDANHHLCFDRDRAGQLFAINFALTKAGKTFNTHITPKGKLIVVDTTDKYQQRHELNPELFEFDQLVKILGADTQNKRNDMAEYMKSLWNKEDIFSGEEYLLPPDLLKAYGKYEIACEEFHSAKYSGLVCNEDLDDIGDKLKISYEAYRAAMKDAVSHYESGGRTIYQPCEKEFKDWNDQLLGKRISAEEDVDIALENNVEAVNGPEERDEENNEEEARTWHFHR